MVKMEALFPSKDNPVLEDTSNGGIWQHNQKHKDINNSQLSQTKIFEHLVTFFSLGLKITELLWLDALWWINLE